MKRAALAALAVTVLGCSATTAPRMTPDVTAVTAPPAGQPPALDTPVLHPMSMCPNLPSGIHCDAMVMADPSGNIAYVGKPTGYSPQDLWSAYDLTPYVTTRGAGQTIGIVTVFDNPKLEQDLAVYRAYYHLAPCTTASGCLRIVDELGNASTAIPTISGQTGLTGQSVEEIAGELSLDVDMASAICPKCHILVVEAYTEGGPGVPVANIGPKDLAQAANTAARLGANVVSTSYGGLDGLDPSETVDDALYNTPTAAQLASSGDSGYGTEYPAASQYVLAAGGTTLKRDKKSTRGWAETAWTSAGSGCSTVEPKPSWQRDGLCPHRMVSDVSAVADPSTGVAVYNTFVAHGGGGWTTTGGTSASSPLLAGIIGLAGNGSTMHGAAYPYAHRNGIRDIQGGYNKRGCGDYTCRGDIGFDGPTGLGSPIGIAGL
ncbi:MAG: S53 family peptidase [Acidimicrobiales bacterium]